MYLDRRKEENESSSEKRKTILMWNGLVSWGGVETGQKEFLKQNCPINRNTYDLRIYNLFLLFTLLTWENNILLFVITKDKLGT